jgi:haloalkane dehalogenase
MGGKVLDREAERARVLGGAAAEYPWESRYLRLRDGQTMQYLDAGEGRPVLMLHGNPTWSFYFRDLVAGLEDCFRCVVPDHIGMGLSDKPDDSVYPHRVGRRAADVGELVDGLGLRRDGPLDLVVHDWGGMIGLLWALRAGAAEGGASPRPIRRLVLLNTAGFLLPRGRAFHWQLRLARSAALSWSVRGLNTFARVAARACSVVPGRMTAERRHAYTAPYDSWESRRAVLRFVQDIPLRPGDPSWADCLAVDEALGGMLANVPVLIAWGGKDFVFDGQFLTEWRRRLPRAELLELPDCGHYVLEDGPERIVPRVREFLRWP